MRKLTIDLPDEVAEAMQKRAAANGQPVEAQVARTLAESLEVVNGDPPQVVIDLPRHGTSAPIAYRDAGPYRPKPEDFPDLIIMMDELATRESGEAAS